MSRSRHSAGFRPNLKAEFQDERRKLGGRRWKCIKCGKVRSEIQAGICAKCHG